MPAPRAQSFSITFMYNQSSLCYGYLREYRYGFNGMEKDDEVKGSGNQLNFGARIYDPRLGRWLSIDPMFKKYPAHSPYNFAVNSPLIFVDPDGSDIYIVHGNERVKFEVGGTYEGNNEFIAQSYKALNFLVQYENETDAEYKVTLKLATDENVAVNVIEVPLNAHPSGVNGAEWNPKQGTMVKDEASGELLPQSPVGTLLHELGHNYDALYGSELSGEPGPGATLEEIDNFLKKSNASSYDNLLEEGVITKVENPFYKWMGQATRSDHNTHGFYEVKGDFTSVEPCMDCGPIHDGVELNLQQ